MLKTKTRGPYAKTAERRATIAEAAHDVVMEVGHDALTTAAVAKRAGISERTMLYHFPTRDHLLVAALELADQFTSDDAFARAGDYEARQMDPDWLDELMDAISRSSVNTDARTRLHVHLAAMAATPDHPARDYFKQHYERAITGIAQQIKSHQAAGIAHPDKDPMTVARRVVAAWDGLQQQWLVTQDFDLPAEIHATFRDLTGRSVMETRQAMEELLAQI